MAAPLALGARCLVVNFLPRGGVVGFQCVGKARCYAFTAA